MQHSPWGHGLMATIIPSRILISRQETEEYMSSITQGATFSNKVFALLPKFFSEVGELLLLT